MDLSQPLLAHVQVAGGGRQAGVAEELLDDGDLHTVLQKMGGEAVTLMPSSA